MKKILPILVLAFATVFLCFLPAVETREAGSDEWAVGEVVEVDDSGVERHGLIEYGVQRLKVDLGNGKVSEATNTLRAQLELDKRFKVGDRAFIVFGGGAVQARDHWRLGWMGLLFALFSALLIVFGGWTGAKALLSFVFSCLAVWKMLVPLCLRGYSAEWTAFATVAILTGVIMYLVAGWTKKGLAAFAGAMLGVVASLVLAEFFTWAMNVNGATMPFVQTLLYSGYKVEIADIFVGAMILASSGAVMDLAMDIAAGVSEVARHNPALEPKELFGSGLAIGRSVVGTMTTTLLLAYSGGYLTLLMVFAAQGTRPIDFLNSTLVSAEMVKTLVGSFGLVLVAPFTAFVSAVVFRRSRASVAR